MSFKIIGGTPKTAKTLCVTCKNATVIKGQNLEEVVRCHHIDKFLSFKVAECSEYTDKRMPDKWEMEKIAWTIECRARGPVGFQGSQMEIEIVPPKKKQYED